MKKRITTYTFDASEKTITFSGAMELEGFLVITNVTDNIIIYNFADSTLGGSITGSILTLDYNTSSMSDTDDLMIMYDDGVDTVAVTQSGTWDEVGINDSGNSITVDGTVTAELSATDNAVLDSIASNTATSALETGGNLASIKTNTDDIETLLTTIEGNQLPDGHNVTIDNGSGASAVNIQDGGNSITVDGSVEITNESVPVSGSVTANAGTNLNTSALALESGGNLASIKSSTDKIPALGQALATASVPVVLPEAQITTLTPPAAITGYSTSAKQDTIIGHIDGIEGSIDGLESAVDGLEGLVDGIEALLGTIDTDTGNISGDTGAIKTAVEVIDNAISGTEMQVDVLTMPTTTVEGTVTANLSATDNAVLDSIKSNTDSGAVVGTGACATAQRVHLADESLAALTPPAAITGYATSAKQDTIAGYVDNIEGYVDGIEGLLTTMDGDTGNIATSTALLDDTVYTDGAGTPSKGLLVLGSDGTNPQALSTDSSGNLQVEVLSAPTTAVTGTFWQETQPVSGTVTANLGATDNAVLDDIAANQTDGTQKSQIVDSGGEAVTVTDGKLDVNATLDPTGLATEAKQDDIITAIGDIPGGGGVQYTEGDTDASITGTAMLMEGAGDELLTVPGTTAGGLLVNLGSNNDVTVTSGTITANLGATDNAVLDQIELNQDAQTALLTTIDADTSNLSVVGGGAEATALRVTIANNSTGVLSVDDNGGALTVDGTVTANLSATDNAVLDDIAADTESIKGYTDGIEDLLTTIDADTSAMVTSLGTLDNTVSGSEIQVDVVASLPAGTNAIGKVGHDITGIGHGAKTVTTAGTDVALAASTPCKKVDIQAQTDNTGIIAIGGSGVDATVATGTGILLNAGDIYSFEIDNLADVYIDSTVDGEGVRFTYYT